MVRIAIVYYSMYGHIAQLARHQKKGVEAGGGFADMFQIRETLNQEVLNKMRAPAQDKKIPFITPEIFASYDAFLFGIPTRFGNYPLQWKAFIDQLGGLWHSGALHGKHFGLFISTAVLGGGQEATAIAALSTWVHHGMVYVPLGCKHVFAHLTDLSQVRGGSPWGAGTFASGDGGRQPSSTELEICEVQGKTFYEQVSGIGCA